MRPTKRTIGLLPSQLRDGLFESCASALRVYRSKQQEKKDIVIQRVNFVNICIIVDLGGQDIGNVTVNVTRGYSTRFHEDFAKLG